MKILVTGGAGFIGSHFIRHLLHTYPRYKIINLDKLTYAGNLDNLKDVCSDKRYSFVKGDICDAALVKTLIKDADALVNFAASTHVDRSIEDSGEFIRTNIFGTHCLLEAARRVRLKLFLQVSTDEVYGSIMRGRSAEQDLLMPNSPYSASKAAGDHLARAYYVTYNVPAVITRSSNNFGPFQYPEKVIPLFITNAIEGKKLPLYGDGLNKRDWIFVLDNCAAIDAVLHRGSIGETYNIGAGNETANIELTAKILRLLDKPQSLIRYVKDRPGHDRRYALNTLKISKLGWRLRYSLDEALIITAAWYQDNKAWWKKLKRAS